MTPIVAPSSRLDLRTASSAVRYSTEGSLEALRGQLPTLKASQAATGTQT